ncbi:Amt family ammonium transporter [Deinococcus metalli]|uniref:Ammonium transporter n=1 Tax=Deinococcus metalli TaxID=1141878 RepID=A0A7W8KGD5_9DEIO|nr:ammonium transporter [Deinococcus metalli]MBB5377681.1 Amt family ammonium transporter [Deinococcus metalli]GHF52518.1 ammonium transporter [Deinococcus metalli]
MKRVWATLALVGGSAFAQAPAGPNGADTAFVLLCAALVLLMTPGLALFYGGLVRAGSVLNTMMMSFAALGVASVAWVAVGYTLAFGPGGNAVIGGLSQLGLGHMAGTLTGTIPTPLYAIFQILFAAITLAVVSGSVVERMRFPAFVVFGLLWILVVYAPLAHWVWSPDGWLARLGVLDFAGGTVVEVTSGVSGLVAAAMLGPRLGYPRFASIPHNVPFVLLGTGLLWFGWLGFNAGSALAAGTTAAYALLNTNSAAAAALLTWMLWDSRRGGRPTAVGAATGAVVGLVAITPACGFVTPLGALLIGAVASSVSYVVVAHKHRLLPDDALDVFACHGTAGIVGTLLTGVLASPVVNPAGAGLLAGHAAQVGIQLVGVLAAAALAGGGTFVLLKVTALITPLRMTERQESQGIDLTAHQEEGYQEAESPLAAPVFVGGD